MKNNAFRALCVFLFALSRIVLAIGMPGALAWIYLRELWRGESNDFLFGLMCLVFVPFYPIFLFGVWLTRLSRVSDYPFGGEPDEES